MSDQHVRAFYEKLSQDEAFHDQVKNAKNQEDFSSIIKAAGYDFTQQELEEYTSELLDGDSLGERELEAIQGGFINRNSPIQIYGSPPTQDYF